jgi:hypothetical protein
VQSRFESRRVQFGLDLHGRDRFVPGELLLSGRRQERQSVLPSGLQRRGRGDLRCRSYVRRGLQVRRGPPRRGLGGGRCLGTGPGALASEAVARLDPGLHDRVCVAPVPRTAYSRRMFIRILGSGAGGGFPQWNCNCHNCAAVRAGASGFRARTQSSLAVSRDGTNWLLLNASPDLRQQIAAVPALSPPRDGGSRGSPIKAVVVTNGDVDHVTGLLTLREGQPFAIYGARRVLDVLAANSLFNVLTPDRVPRIPLSMGQSTRIGGAGVELGLVVEVFAVQGKVALYLEDVNAGPNFGTQEGRERVEEPPRATGS